MIYCKINPYVFILFLFADLLNESTSTYNYTDKYNLDVKRLTFNTNGM